MTVSQITDHAAQALATQSTWTHTRERIRKLCELIADQVQLMDNVTWQVLTNSILATATGDILDEYGKIFDHARGALTDAQYRRALSTVIAAHQSDGLAKEVIYLASTLIGVPVRYQQYQPAAYRLTYTIATAIASDWETRVLAILEIARPAGVSYQLVEGDSTGAGTFTFNIGPGFNQGKLARRVL